MDEYNIFGTEDDDPNKQLAGLISPTSAAQLTGISRPPDGGAVRSIYTAPQDAQTAQPAPAQPVQAQAQSISPGAPTQAVNPDPNGSLRPGGSNPGAQPGAMNRFQQSMGGAPVQNVTGAKHNGFWRGLLNGAGKVADVAGSFLEPQLTQFIPKSTLYKQRMQQQVLARQDAQSQIDDRASQASERNAIGRKNDELAKLDAPMTLTPELANGLGRPELAGTSIGQRAYQALALGKTAADSRKDVGASHDQARITATGMRDQTSTANNAATNTTRAGIAESAHKTQMLLGQLRANTSASNNERTNQTHMATAGLKAAGGAPGQPGSFKVPADVTKRAALANNVQENAGEVSKLLDTNPDIIGSVAGRYTNAEQMIGNDNPAISALGTRIHNIALAANGAHGVRSAEAVHATEKEILNNFHNGPHAIKGALDATTSSVQTFLDDEKNFRTTGGRVVPPSGGAGAVKPGFIRVQIPGHAPGQIPVSNRSKFLADHKDAQVLNDR